jgi:hypothetical protein
MKILLCAVSLALVISGCARIEGVGKAPDFTPPGATSRPAARAAPHRAGLAAAGG